MTDPVKVDAGNPDISISESYSTSDGRDLLLSVVIGEGQTGLSTVLLDTTPVPGLSNQETITNAPIGEGRTVRGKTLVVDTIVNDVNPSTDRVTVTYQLSGGPAPAAFTAQGTAAAAGAATFVEALIALE